MFRQEKFREEEVTAGHDRIALNITGKEEQQISPWAQTYIEANPDILKARRRVDLEPEWRFRRPVAVNVDAAGRIFVLEATRHRLQVYNKVKDFEDASLNL